MRVGPAVRFAIWVLAVAGALIPRLGIAVHFISLGVIFVLLCTTPRDAILLPRWLSGLVIVSATIALHSMGLRLFFTIMLLIILRLWQKSPWWAVFVGWYPL